jgi:NAD(P)-dependent dehydrogenase (short-subunit alcohol dehydrogenase family)
MTPTAVITGGNTGIGKETARGLVAAGMRVIIASRNQAKAEAAVRELADGTGSVEYVPLDLADLASVRGCANQLRERLDHIDVLINNAGVILGRRRTTTDGFEATFGINHLGHFLLTHELRDLLDAAPAARVITVTSDGHRQGGRLNFDDLMLERRYRSFVAYCRSKLANVLFTRELAKRTTATTITANCLHPGFVASEFALGGDAPLLSIGLFIARPFAISPAKGARTSIHLATSPDVADLTGLYFEKCQPAVPSTAAQNDDDARRLWEVSERLVGITA